jgi:hypothetical protein
MKRTLQRDTEREKNRTVPEDLGTGEVQENPSGCQISEGPGKFRAELS